MRRRCSTWPPADRSQPTTFQRTSAGTRAARGSPAAAFVSGAPTRRVGGRWRSSSRGRCEEPSWRRRARNASYQPRKTALAGIVAGKLVGRRPLAAADLRGVAGRCRGPEPRRCRCSTMQAHRGRGARPGARQRSGTGRKVRGGTLPHGDSRRPSRFVSFWTVAGIVATGPILHPTRNHPATEKAPISREKRWF
jgi:hypothetical protein